jgi:4-amino-4-deoxy-L-arabinose transferase-like glycosyltransferase
VRRPERLLVLWLLSALLVLGVGIGLRDPSPPDEPRFAMMARDMVETGNWLVPHRGSEIYAEKPPVFIWLQASSYAVVGNLRIAFLLPSLLAGVLTLWLVHDLAQRLWGARAGLAASVALGLCLQFGLQAKRAQIDMVVVAMITGSIWAMGRHLFLGHSPRWLWLGAFLAGVGTVTKGVGFLPLLVLMPAVVLERRGALPLPEAPHGEWPLRWWLVWPAFVAGTAVWLAPLGFEMLRGQNPELKPYLAELLLRQTGERYFNAWHHIKPWWYYAEVIASLWLPGTLLLPWLAPVWWRRLREGDPVVLTLLAWATMVLLFFSASPGKRGVYIFPALPALCVAAGPFLGALLERTGVRRVLFGYGFVVASLLAAVGLAGLFGPEAWSEQLAAPRGMTASEAHAVFVGLLVAGAVGLATMLAARTRRVVPAVRALTAIVWTSYGMVLRPALDPSSSGRRVMSTVAMRLPTGAELALVAWTEQMRLQADRPVADFGFKASGTTQWRSAVPWLVASPSQRWALARADTVPACVDRTRLIDVGVSNRRAWSLVPGEAVAGRCGPTELGPAARETR